MIPRTKIENATGDLFKSLRARGGSTEAFGQALGQRLALPPPFLASCASAGFYFLLKALPDRPIYLPAYTCRALFEACILAGRIHDVRSIDIELDTYGMDLDALEKRVEPGSILVATHQFGIPADMDHFRTIAERTKSFLVEDAAAAFGASIQGRAAGTFGDASLFSFDPTKTLSACGGGAVFFRDGALQKEVEDLAKKERESGAAPSIGPILRCLAYNAATQEGLYGAVTLPLWTRRDGPYRDRGQLRTDRLAIYRRPFGDNQAKAGLCNLKKIDGVLTRRKEIETLYRDRLAKKNPAFATYRPLHGSETSLVLFPVRVTQEDKSAVYQRCASRGVDLGFTFSYVNTQGRKIGELENSLTAARQVLNLPFYSKLTDRQANTVCDVLAEVSSPTPAAPSWEEVLPA